MTTRSRTYAALPAPFGKFAHATVLPLAGTKLVFVSSVTARESGAMDAEAQTRVIYERIQTILEEERGGFQHVLDIDDHPATNRIREEFFAGFNAPASTLVAASGFVRPDVRAEIECTEAIPENAQ
jgi:2-iminobutanoate/2-iminopropanoate deaminase